MYIIAEGWDGNDEITTTLHLCPVAGAIFICGTQGLLTVGDRRVHYDETLQRGLDSIPSEDWGWTDRLYGSWPDDAWLVVVTMGTVLEKVFSWQNDRWHYAGDLSGLQKSVSPWYPGRLLALTQNPESKPQFHDFGLGPARMPKVQTKQPDGLRPQASVLGVDMRALPTGEVVGLFDQTQPDRTLVVRWAAGEELAEILLREGVPTPEGDCEPSSIQELTSTRMILAGLLEHGRGRCVIELEGGGAQARPDPPSFPLGTNQVRTPGAEWLLVRSRPNLSKPWRPVEGEVWRRVANGDWHRVQVPQPLFPTDGVSEPLVPVSMIAVGDEVWLLAYYHSQHPKSRNRAGRGVLLSNVYREPCDLNRDTDCAGRLARYP